MVLPWSSSLACLEVTNYALPPRRFGWTAGKKKKKKSLMNEIFKSIDKKRGTTEPRLGGSTELYTKQQKKPCLAKILEVSLPGLCAWLCHGNHLAQPPPPINFPTTSFDNEVTLPSFSYSTTCSSWLGKLPSAWCWRGFARGSSYLNLNNGL